MTEGSATEWRIRWALPVNYGMSLTFTCHKRALV